MERRAFIKTAAAATAGAFTLPQFSIGKPGPSANSKLNIAMIGAGNIAAHAYVGCRSENLIAVCDVDSKMFGQQANKFPAIGNAATFTDFRVMLDKMGKEIDGICVNTPDHTHFVATLAAMERGIHVCTQKPLTHTIWEARTLQRAKRKYKVITNMGNQGHTYDGIRKMREWYESDVFGQVKEVHSWMPGPDWAGAGFNRPSSFPPPEAPVPDSLNYDLWLGPTAETPFHVNYHPKSWRAFNQFGTGQFGDWFCHVADAPVWILDLYAPTVVEAEEVVGGNEWMVPDGNRVRFEFAKRGAKEPCTFYWYNGDSSFRPPKPEKWTWSANLPRSGTLFMGDKKVGYTDERSNNPRLADREEMRAFKEAGYPEAKYERLSGGPHVEWVRAIKGDGSEPGANFDYAAPMTEVALLGVLACRFGGRIEWDANKMEVTNRPELNAYVKEAVRPGWEYGESLWG